MAAKKCLNIHYCGTTSCAQWKTGWRLRSGELANLCDKCGYAFEQRVFCEEFHNDESGWRNCVTCGKRLHCGCIASLHLITLVPNGVKCSDDCADNSVPAENAALGLMNRESSILPVAETEAQLNQAITSGVSSGNLQLTPATVTDEREQGNMSAVLNQDSASLALTSTPPTRPSALPSNEFLSMRTQLCLARCSGQGRGGQARHQLFSRYWPRLTDQEVQQINGPTNSTVIPLFEKVLSASDVSPLGRLVLPKACAEAYFPSALKPEGFPIKVLDVNRKEWGFQFRYWPNTISRIYVLEGVAQCLQSMHVKAGDTVTFCCTEPDGKLVMSFRKPSDSSAQTTMGNADAPTNALPGQSASTAINHDLHSIEQSRGPPKAILSCLPVVKTRSQKARDIEAKSNEKLPPVYTQQHAQALKLTLEEVQGMLCPLPNAKPNIVVAEGFKIEEYKDPAVLGKRSVLATRLLGETEQWAQCDNCSKWRRLPFDFLLPPKWKCADNSWDPARWFCSAPEELSPEDREDLIKLSNGFKKKKMRMGAEVMQETENSVINTFVDAVNLGDDPTNEAGTSAVATSSKVQNKEAADKP